MVQNFNPLMDFARKVECSVKLPSNGGWYDSDNITFNQIGEVDIKPMLPNDEMMVVNPESLISGNSIIEIIKSCCPGIKKPEELYYPDINVLLLGIKKATYGKEHTQEYICPKCWSVKTNILGDEILKLIKERYPNGNVDISKEESKEIESIADENIKSLITEKERNNELCITPQELKINLDDILGSITYMPYDGLVKLNNGVKVYTTPYKCSDKIKFITKKIKFQKLYKHISDSSGIYDNTDEITEEYIKSLEDLSNVYKEIGNLGIDIISASIKYIETPNGEKVDNYEYISEFIRNIDVESVSKIRNKIDELNNYGIIQTLECECMCCGYKWNEKFYGYNQNDFFGISS